jgi:predicted Zn-dependent protease
MATFNEVLLGAEIVYGDKSSPQTMGQGWVKIPDTAIDSSRNDSVGYQGATWINPSTGDMIVGNRGTQITNVKNLATDLAIALRIHSETQDAADKYARDLVDYVVDKYPDLAINHIETTGHSLGGTLAQNQNVELTNAIRDLVQKNPDSPFRNATVGSVVVDSPGANLRDSGQDQNYNAINISSSGDLVHYAGGPDLKGTLEISLPANQWIAGSGGKILGLVAEFVQPLASLFIESASAATAHKNTSALDITANSALGNLDTQMVAKMNQAQVQALTGMTANQLQVLPDDQRAALFSMSGAEMKAFIAALPNDPPVYDAAGYSQYGYDKNGYDIYGRNAAGFLDPSIPASGVTHTETAPDGSTINVAIQKNGLAEATILATDGTTYDYQTNTDGRPISVKSVSPDGSTAIMEKNGPAPGSWSATVKDAEGNTLQVIGQDNSDGSASAKAVALTPTGAEIDSAVFKQNADGSGSSDIINTDTGGTNQSVEQIRNLNANGAIQNEQLITKAADGTTSATISGTGAVVNFDNAAVTVLTGASATINGNNSTLTLEDNATATVNGSGNTMFVGANASLAYTSTDGLAPNLITLASGATFIDHADTTTVGDIIKQVASASGINVTVASGTVNAELSNATIVTQKDSTLNIVGNGNAITLGANASATINDDPVNSSGTNTLQTSQGAFTLVGMHQVSTGADGQLLQDQWLDSSTGHELLQTDYTHGVKADVIDFKNGQEVDAKTYDTGGNLVAEDIFTSDIGVSKKTDHELFGSDGQLTQDIQYDPLTGNTSTQLDYVNGVKTDQIDFTNNVETAEQWFDANNRKTDEAFFANINGTPVESDYETFDLLSGQVTQEQQYSTTTKDVIAQIDYSNGLKIDQVDFNNNVGSVKKWFNTTGQVTQEELFENVGGKAVETDYETFNPSTGSMLQDIQFSTVTGYETTQTDYIDGKKTDQIDLINNIESDEKWFNSIGQTTNEELCKAIGGLPVETDYETFNTSTGQLTQDTQFSTTTGYATTEIDYTNGVKSDQVDFINNIESDEKFFNSTGQMTDEVLFNAINGSPIESSYRWFDSLGRETAESKFNNSGQQTDYDTLDPNTGVITQDLLVRSGAVYQELDYNDSASNHYETNQVNYSAGGDVTNEAFFNASGQETQYLANLANGQSTVQFFGSDLPNGYTSWAQTYSGLDAQGAITTLQGTNASGYTINENITYNSAGQESGFTIDWHTPSGVDEGTMDFNSAGSWTGGWDSYLATDPAGSAIPNEGPLSLGNGGDGGYGYYGFTGADGTITTSLGADIGTIAHYDLAQGDTTGAQVAQRGRLEAAAAAQAAQSGKAGSAVLDGARWDSHLITWSLASTANATTSSVYMDAEYEKAAQDAFAKWGSASGLSFQEVTDSAHSDIRIGWDNFDTSNSGVVGYTSFHRHDGQMPSDTRIRLEDPTQLSLVRGADGQLTYAGTEAELGQVLEHEIGHALGFADNADPTSIMYYALSANNRTLDATDIAGVRDLYGEGSLSSHTATSVNQLIQAMSLFGAPSGAAVTDLMHPTVQPPKALTLAAPVTV